MPDAYEEMLGEISRGVESASHLFGHLNFKCAGFDSPVIALAIKPPKFKTTRHFPTSAGPKVARVRP